MQAGGGDSCGSTFVIKLRGLPFSATVKEIIDFLGDVEIVNGEEGVHVVRQGVVSKGECFVEVCSMEDVEKALSKNKEYLGQRYIEVFHSNEEEMNFTMNSSSRGSNGFSFDDDIAVIKLRGLPFSCTVDDIVDFFDGVEVSAEGVHIMRNDGRATGEAFVHLRDGVNVQKALAKDREKLGHRYIEVFSSSDDEYRAYSARVGGGGGGGRGAGASRGGFMRPTPYDRNDRFSSGRWQRGAPARGNFRGGFQSRGGYSTGRGGYGGGGGGNGGGWNQTSHSVHMRGLPFKATPDDIAYFFKPLNPINIDIHYDKNNRPSGEADVEFECHEDAMLAMRRDKSNMDHRYIELFLNSSDGGYGGGLGSGPGPAANYKANFNRHFVKGGNMFN